MLIVMYIFASMQLALQDIGLGAEDLGQDLLRGDEDGSRVSGCRETAGRSSIFISNVEWLWRY